ncbi:CDGSH iron-sulfur domain-containing protein [Streptomyces sp. NPDC058286]|uniref:CDGSH iron-sulfur domain-containing protein n=1 Tax=Streptomyces sp. NPDC058286 TaxID=3346422 RepID=UPI0036EF84E0
MSVSRRFTVAICTCRRSRTYPWCDTSHRARTRPRSAAECPGDEHGREGGPVGEP